MSLKKLILGAAAALMITSTQPIQADCCDLCTGWDIYADWLYWKPRGCELDYAAPFNGVSSLGNVEKLKAKYDNGFRLGLQKGCDCLDFGIEYTYFRTDRNAEVVDTANGNIAGTHLITRYTALTQGDIQKATGDWDIQYNVLDLLAGMKMDFGSCIEARMFTGLKFAAIDQSFKSTYRGGTGELGNILDIATQKNKLKAYGFTLGTSSRMELVECFNFFGNFSYDLLFARTKRRFQYDISTDLGTTVTTLADLKDECYRLVSVFNFAFGIEYDLCQIFCVDSKISFGYEYHQWLNTPGFMNHHFVSNEFTFDRHNDNLSLDGLFLRLGIHF